jgi:hypothetical protein
MIYQKCIILYSICYGEIQLHRLSKFVVLMYIFYLTVICIPIKSHQTTLRNFIGCQCSLLLLLTFYDLQYMCMHTLCCLRTIYAKYLNSTTKSNNFYNSNQTYKESVTGTD